MEIFLTDDDEDATGDRAMTIVTVLAAVKLKTQLQKNINSDMNMIYLPQTPKRTAVLPMKLFLVIK